MQSASRGQVGIGTLIVFMAMVLVAAMAAGALVEVGGFLQSQGEATGEQATGQVTNGVVVTGAFAEVTPEADDGLVNGTVAEVRLVVGRSPGAGNVNLSRATIGWVGPRQAATLHWTAGTADSETFATRELTGGSAQVLSAAEDRIEVVVNATAVEENTDDFSGADDRLYGLHAGEQAKVRVTTQYGASTTYWVDVPESVTGSSAVRV
jgi:flagellin-like protein